MGKAIIYLYKNIEYAKELGENGRRAVTEKYNWKNEGEKLVGLYKLIEEEKLGK
jgi:glycosyltransferase involved in cell wall biosynthesis